MEFYTRVERLLPPVDCKLKPATARSKCNSSIKARGPADAQPVDCVCVCDGGVVKESWHTSINRKWSCGVAARCNRWRRQCSRFPLYFVPRSIFSATCWAKHHSVLLQRRRLYSLDLTKLKTQTANLPAGLGAKFLVATFTWKKCFLWKVQVNHYLHSQVVKCHAAWCVCVCDLVEELWYFLG